MIYDRIERRAHYAAVPRLQEALDFISRLDCGQLPAEVLYSEDGALRYIPVKLRTKAEDECLFEAHRRYIDVHYIVSGHERIAVSALATLNPSGPFDEDKDVAFYQGISEHELVLKPGDFLYCLPEDAHKVAMWDQAAEDVEKIVVKIPV